MNISSLAEKVGGFAAVNNGTIENCFTSAKTKSKINVAGFVYENTGSIKRSVRKGKTKASQNCGEFFCVNNGTLENCSWVDINEKKVPKIKETPKTDAGVEGTESESKPESLLEQKERALREENEKYKIESEDAGNIKERLGLGDEWNVVYEEKGVSISLDHNSLFGDKNMISPEIIYIDSAEQLMNITASIAQGNEQAANAYYRLSNNINLHGKKWIPMGISEQNAFRGVFDGAGFGVYNFTVRSSKFDYSGFFGYIKGGKVLNLKLDCEIDSKNSLATGSLAGVNENGLIANCHVVARVNSEKCFGGFIGKNIGKIIRCGFAGQVVHGLSPLAIIVPTVAAGVALLSIGSGVMVWKVLKSPYTPEIIDPNAVPAPDDGIKPPPLEPGSNRISYELNQEVKINVDTQTGLIDYVNPNRCTQDVVISVRVTDAELEKVLGNCGRSERQLQKLKEELEKEGKTYDENTSYHELYRSGRIKIGYGIKAIKLGKLQNGDYLPAGEYNMTVMIEAYDPVTFEKATVSAAAAIKVIIK